MATTLNLDDDSLQRAVTTYRHLNEMMDRHIGQVPTPVSALVWQLATDLGLERSFEPAPGLRRYFRPGTQVIG